MVSPILSALTSGFTSKQIVDYLIRKFPEYADKIRSALSMGYAPEKILKQLTGGRKALTSDESPSKTEHEVTREKDISRRENVNKGVAGAAALAGSALGGYALSRALPQSAQMAIGALGGSPTGPQPNTTPILPQSSQMETLAGPSTSPQVPPPQPTIEIPVQKASEEIVKKPSLFESLKSSKRTPGTPLDDFAKYARHLMKKGDINDEETLNNFQKWWGATEGRKRGSPFAEFERFRVETPWIQKKQEQLPEQIQPEVSKEEKGLVALPSGQIGEIESVKDGVAKINADGQIKHRKLSELIQEPEEIRNAIHDMLQIKESERSAIFDFVTYDPTDRRLYIQFPNGKTVVYMDVDSEHANAIREGKGVPKTSGQTKTGERWIAGIPDSRGAEFISRIKSDKKYSKENEGKTWYYLEDIYDKYGKLRLKPKRKKERQ